MFAPDSKTTAVNHGDSIRVQALVTTGEQVVTGLQCRYNTDATGAYDIKALQTGINEFYIPNVAASANDGIAFTLPSIEGYSVKVYFNDTDVSSLIRPDADAWQLQCNGSDYRNANSMWSIVYEKDEPAVSKGITWTGFVVGDVENGCFANVMPNGDSNLMLGSLNNETTYAQVETNLKADDINGVIANLMVKHGYAKTKNQAFADYLNRLHAEDDYVRPEEAIRGILGAGGVPVLAHPCFGDGDQLILGEELETRVRRLRDMGLQGLEAYYSGFTSPLRRQVLSLAERCSLYVTAGSDYHGTNKTVKLGDTGLTDASEWPDGLRRFLREVCGIPEPS
jgi:hypothetical protein